MPRPCEGLFRRRRELLLDLSQCGAEALSEYLRREVGVGTRPGIVVSVASAGDLLQWHPHGHIFVTDGAFSDDGKFHPLETWGADAVMKLFRERLLARLTLRHAICEELARKLLAWRDPSGAMAVVVLSRERLDVDPAALAARPQKQQAVLDLTAPAGGR
jgi:hypothetical protein